MAAVTRAVLLVALCAAGCAPAARTTTTAAPAAAVPGHGDEGVRFMRDMIVHHAQALELTALVPARSPRAELHRLAERIEASQQEEMALMRRWLQSRGAAAPAEHAGHEHAAPMPGMLSAAEIAAVARAQGGAFERLFLEAMIRHHEGALTMVAALFDGDAANRDVELFQFASGIDADQRAEITRMRRLLASFPQ